MLFNFSQVLTSLGLQNTEHHTLLNLSLILTDHFSVSFAGYYHLVFKLFLIFLTIWWTHLPSFLKAIFLAK